MYYVCSPELGGNKEYIFKGVSQKPIVDRRSPKQINACTFMNLSRSNIVLGNRENIYVKKAELMIATNQVCTYNTVHHCINPVDE